MSTVLLCLGLALTCAPSDASAQGTGFTGEMYWGYVVFNPGVYSYAGEIHSYGFNSAKNIRTGIGNGYVGAGIENYDTNRVAASGVGFNQVRVCVHGTYPNCVDTDGWAGGVWVQNDDQQASLMLRGHGVY